MAKLVPGVMKRLGLAERVHQAQVFHQWSQIVGQDIARHAQPVALKNGILTVHVDHPTWHHALLPMKPLVLQRVQNLIGKTAVRNIVFRIG